MAAARSAAATPAPPDLVALVARRRRRHAPRPALLAFFAPGAFYDLLAPLPAAERPLPARRRLAGRSRSALARARRRRAAARWRVPMLGIAHASSTRCTPSATSIDVGDADPSWHGPFALVTPGRSAPSCCSAACSSGRRRAMKILLAGATGAIGRPLVRRSSRPATRSSALTRSPDSVASSTPPAPRRRLRRHRPRRRAAHRRATSQPDVVLDQTTALPQRYDAAAHGALLQGHGRRCACAGRRTSSRPRERPARGSSSRASRSSTRPDGGTGAPAHRGRPALSRRRARRRGTLALPAIVALERARRSTSAALVLRYGMFYGPGTHFAHGGQIAEDVARAAAADRRPRAPACARSSTSTTPRRRPSRALELGRRGILNVVDDEPIADARVAPAASRRRSARQGRCACRAASPGASPAPLPLHWRRRCRARRTPARRSCSAGRRAYPRRARGSASSPRRWSASSTRRRRPGADGHPDPRSATTSRRTGRSPGRCTPSIVSGAATRSSGVRNGRSRSGSPIRHAAARRARRARNANSVPMLTSSASVAERHERRRAIATTTIVMSVITCGVPKRGWVARAGRAAAGRAPSRTNTRDWPSMRIITRVEDADERAERR